MSVLPEEDGVYEDAEIIAEDAETLEETNEIYPTKTWRLDRESGRIIEVIDDEEALYQFITKALRTARYRYRIYDEQYGNEIEGLIGSNVSDALAQSEIPRLIEEALIYDDRINEVRTLNVRRESDKLYADVEVDSVYGDVQVEVAI